MNKEKTHDLINATYIDGSLIRLQNELMKPAHNGLFLKMFIEHKEEMTKLSDQMEFLTLLCTTIGIPLNGEYTAEELAEKILPKLEEERRLQELIIVNKVN